MKKLLFIFSFVLTATAIAQTTTTTIQFEKQKLDLAKKYGDEGVITAAMYSIIALEGPKSMYKDSLAYEYFNNRNYVSCFLVTNDVLKLNPNKIDLLEMKAISLESMGALEKASQTYEELLSKTISNYHAYKLAGLQMALKKYEEANKSIKKADQLADSGKVTINFQVNKNFTQKVNLKAAIAYLEGIIAIRQEKNAEAKVSFERAIKLFPEFVLAKGELTSLEENQTK